MTSQTTSSSRRPLNGFAAAVNGVSAIARGGFALVLGTLIASGMGMIFWAIAARTLSPEQFGIGAALISALTTLSHASQLNLRNILHRFVPSAGSGASTLIYRSYAVAAAVAVVLGAGFALLAPRISPELAFLASSPVAVVAFAAALLIWTLYALQEATLTALRLASYMPLQTLANAILKIALLVALTMMLGNWSAIIGSWVLAALVVGLFTHLQTSRATLASGSASGQVESVSWAKIASFFGWDYVGALATSIALGIAPLVIVSLVGPTEAAPYFIASSFSYLLYLVARHAGSAMLAELAANRHRKTALYAETIVLTVIPVLCGVAGLFLLAPVVMMIFGPHYVAVGTDILRVLALSCIPGSLVAVYLAICRAEDWGRMIALVQVATLVAVLVVGTSLVSVLGPIGMAWGWLAGYTIAALLAGGLSLIRHSHVAALDFAVDLTSATRRLAQQVARFLPTGGRSSVPGEQVTIAGKNWRVEGSTPASLSDASTQRLVGLTGEQTPVVAKRATTEAGRRALRREYEALVRLHDDTVVLEAIGSLLPHPLHYQDLPAETILLLSQLPGSDARATVDSPSELLPVLASINGTLDKLHDVRSEFAPPTQAWLSEWVDAPLARITHAVGEQPGIRRVAEELRHVLGSDPLRLGLGHGDFCPDNLLVQKNAATGVLEPSGLVDWGGYRPDTPQGFDACTMALTLRSYQRGKQLGQVVLELLGEPEWTESELRWLGSSDAEWLDDPRALRAMVLLAWLQHVDSNLGKSVRYSGRGNWGFANIRLVVAGAAQMSD